MLKYDPAARITAEKALTHGWLAGRDAADKALKASGARRRGLDGVCVYVRGGGGG